MEEQKKSQPKHKIIQTDADNTIYQGNLIISLGWFYLGYLLKNKHWGSFLNKLFQLPFFYFLSWIPRYFHKAFYPFKDCPVDLLQKLKNPVKEDWVNKVEEFNPEKIIIITDQERTILETYIGLTPTLKKYNFEIISNEVEIKNNKFTDRVNIKLTPTTKAQYIQNDKVYLGDLRDYLFYRGKLKKFILIT